jgi:ABC-2 type transport system ATP-binding protein
MGENVILTENLTKRFGNFTAVDSVSFSVNRGEILGFLGANGAGKTTAIKMLTGLLAPTSGKATVAGFDLFTQTESIKRSIGYMSQRFSLYDDLSPRENIRFFGGIYGLEQKTVREKGEQMLQALGLIDEADKRLASLPLGWKQKLAFSVALLHEPKIVFLDEPTGGVDPITRRRFWDLIYETADRGVTMFVTTHYMDEAEYCDRVSIMVDGRIAALDTPEALKQQFHVPSMNELFIRLARAEKGSAS